MRILAFSNRSTFFAVRSHQLIGKFLMSRATLLVPNGSQHPAECQALLAVLVDLHWHLIGRTTNSLGANLDVRFNVFDRLFENLNGWSIY